MPEKFNAIDLFAGCGGLTDGFMQTGQYNTLAAVDWELPTVLTLRERLKSRWKYLQADKKVIHFDIQRTDELLNGFEDPYFGSSEGLIKLAGDKNTDIIVGGPPCQAYSIAGRVRDKNGMQDDYRNYLFESYVKVVDHFKPKSFVFENVEGILSAKPGNIAITDRIRESFEKIGYKITSDLRENALFDLSYYGIPQRRKRVIIYGVSIDKNDPNKIEAFYSLMKSKKHRQPATVKEAFENLPKIYPTQNAGNPKVSHEVYINGTSLPSNHEPRFHSLRDIKIFETLASDIESKTFRYADTQSLINLYEEATGNKSKFHKYHVIRTDKPSNTIPAHLYKDGLRHIHPDPKQARSITVREAARIQTFDDEYLFLGSRGDQYKMIGNAVPPKFAKIIAETICTIEN